MITDIRPIVERLLRSFVLAGLPLVTACDSQRALNGPLGSGGATSVTGTGGDGGGGTGDLGTGGVGTGGSGTGGSGTGGSGTGGSGTGGFGTGGAPTGAGGASACVPLSFGCGFRSTCPPFPGSDGGVGAPLTLTVRNATFALDDPRLIDFYRACLASQDTCGPDCKGFCLAANGLSTTTFSNYFECDVTCGAQNAVKISYESAVCGRRPTTGLLRRGCNRIQPRAETFLGRLLAEAAELEAASVPAFAHLAADLTAHGAPEALVRAARGAMADEARHWRRTRDVARRKGGEPVRPTVASRTAVSSLQALAIDNVVEGCVRETFGALAAAHQAATAADPDVAALMTGIADDEMNHAALAWRIDAWTTERLGDSFRVHRDVAARAALRELAAGVTRPVEAELRAAAGLPGPAEAGALLVATWEVLWRPAFGDAARV